MWTDEQTAWLLVFVITLSWTIGASLAYLVASFTHARKILAVCDSYENKLNSQRSVLMLILKTLTEKCKELQQEVDTLKKDATSKTDNQELSP